MDTKQLEALHAELKAVDELIDTAPDRFQSTSAGHLSEADSAVILAAGRVVHRLMLWTRFPEVSPDSYLPRPDAAGELEPAEPAAAAYNVTLSRYGRRTDLEVTAPTAADATHEALAIQGDDWTVLDVARVQWGNDAG